MPKENKKSAKKKDKIFKNDDIEEDITCKSESNKNGTLNQKSYKSNPRWINKDNFDYKK